MPDGVRIVGGEGRAKGRGKGVWENRKWEEGRRRGSGEGGGTGGGKRKEERGVAAPYYAACRGPKPAPWHLCAF